MLLFLGAGASKSFDIPDTKGFISDFEKAIGENKIYSKLKKSIPDEMFDTEVLMTILDDLSKPKEELLNSIAPHTTRFLLQQESEKGYWIENEELKVFCHDLLREIKRVIRTKCLTQVRVKREEILRSYDMFFKSITRYGKEVSSSDTSGMSYPNLSLFTTNYDTCMEVYFNARKVNLFRGVIEKFNEYVFDVSTFIPRKGNAELIKLHGSVDLFIKDRKIRFLSGAGAMDTSAITYLGDEYGVEFMVYPVESSVSSKLSQSPLIELMYIFRERLNIHNVWVIIGTTFRDLTLVSIMNDVLIQKNEKEYPIVLHINPAAKQINDYLAAKGFELLARIIKPIESSFMDSNLAAQLAQKI
jgi:hypothetical protein